MRGYLSKLIKRFNFDPNLKDLIYYVHDGAEWSFKWDAHYITKSLEHEIGRKVISGTDPWELRRSDVIFGNRYSIKHPDFGEFARKNRVFVVWFHGDRKMKNPGLDQLLDILHKNIDYIQKIIVPNRETREAIITEGFLHEKVATIPIGVDCYLFHPATEVLQTDLKKKYNVPEDCFCVGSFQKDGKGWGDGDEPKLEKGPDVFWKVMQRIAPSIDNLHVLLTGPSRGYLKKKLDSIGVPYTHVYFDDYQQIVEAYQILDVYLIGSRVEGGPKALAESWATKTVVVSGAMGMPADWIENGENGFLSEVGNVEEMGQSILELHRKPELKEAILESAYLKVKQLDWTVIGKKYCELIS